MILSEEHLDFPPADMNLIAQRRLQRRIDQKFLLSQQSLVHVLREISPYYSIVLSGEKRVARYQTLYLDTANHRCVTEHHKGRRPRYKIDFVII